MEIIGTGGLPVPSFFPKQRSRFKDFSLLFAPAASARRFQAQDIARIRCE